MILAALGGAFAGMAEAKLNWHGWAMVPGLAAVIVAAIAMAWWHFWRPLDRLLDQAHALVRNESGSHLSALPVQRQDELGALARVIGTLATSRLRDYHDARQLRRTLDDRVAKATRQATRQLRRLALRDPLTGLGNRRFLQEQLEALVHSVRESREDLVCLAVDVDGFKQVNDVLGHAAGDELLIFLASLLRAGVRREDYAIRLGGDEFVLLLPAASPERARLLAQRLVALFAQQSRSALPADCRAGISIGLASVLADKPASGAELLEKADQRLYAAKRAGKNQVM